MQAYSKGLIDGKFVYTDLTYLKSNANKNKFTNEGVKASAKECLNDLEEAVNKAREEHGQKPL